MVTAEQLSQHLEQVVDELQGARAEAAQARQDGARATLCFRAVFDGFRGASGKVVCGKWEGACGSG